MNRLVALLGTLVALTACPSTSPKATATLTSSASPSTSDGKRSTPAAEIGNRIAWARFTPTGLVALVDGRLLRSRNLGADWDDITPPLKAGSDDAGGIYEAMFISKSIGWVSAANAETAGPIVVFRTRDGARTWRKSIVSRSSVGIHAGSNVSITFVDALRGWLGSSDPAGPVMHIWQTEDGGRTWKTLETQNVELAVGDLLFTSSGRAVGSSVRSYPAMGCSLERTTADTRGVGATSYAPRIDTTSERAILRSSANAPSSRSPSLTMDRPDRRLSI